MTLIEILHGEKDISNHDQGRLHSCADLPLRMNSQNGKTKPSIGYRTDIAESMDFLSLFLP